MSNKRSGNKKSGLVPRLRFPEFRDAGEWLEYPVSKMLEEALRPVKMHDEDSYTLVTVKRKYGGITLREHLTGREILVKSQFRLKRDDFLISKRQIVHCACGIVPSEFDGAVVSNEYSIFQSSELCDIDFFDYFVQQPLVSESFRKCCVGIVIEKMLFKQEQWLKSKFLFPRIEEQKRIADCLSSLDKLVSAEAQKLDALKAHKKGLMQQLFPRDGETVPRLRFPEFRDAGVWRKDLLGNIFGTTSGGTPNRSIKEYWNGRIPWITTSLVDCNVIHEAEEFISEEGLLNSSAKLLPKGTVLVAMYGQGKTRGKVAMLGIEAATNQACAAILPAKEVTPEFVFLNLGSRYEEMRALSNSGGQENLSQDLIRKLPFLFPHDVAEQQRISDCLSSLDQLINAQDQKMIHALKAHKKGLMQQLFPTMYERHA